MCIRYIRLYFFLKIFFFFSQILKKNTNKTVWRKKKNEVGVQNKKIINKKSNGNFRKS